MPLRRRCKDNPPCFQLISRKPPIFVTKSNPSCEVKCCTPNCVFGAHDTVLLIRARQRCKQDCTHCVLYARAPQGWELTLLPCADQSSAPSHGREIRFLHPPSANLVHCHPDNVPDYAFHQCQWQPPRAWWKHQTHSVPSCHSGTSSLNMILRWPSTMSCRVSHFQDRHGGVFVAE